MIEDSDDLSYEDTHNYIFQKGKGEVLSYSAQFMSCKYKKPGKKNSWWESKSTWHTAHHTDTFCQGRWKEKPKSKPEFVSYTSPWGPRRNPAPQFGALCSHSYSLHSRNVLADGSRGMEYITALNKLTGWALGLIWWMQDQLLMQMRILIMLWLPCFSVSEHISICIQLKSEINNETQKAFWPSVRHVHISFFRARILVQKEGKIKT